MGRKTSACVCCSNAPGNNNKSKGMDDRQIGAGEGGVGNRGGAVDVAALAAAAVGGAAVVATYAATFGGERQGYFESRFWLGVPPSTARALCYALQIPAGVGYLVFLAYAAGVVGKGAATKGVLQYQLWRHSGLTLAVVVFSVASVLWPLATRRHLDEGWSRVHRDTGGDALPPERFIQRKDGRPIEALLIPKATHRAANSPHGTHLASDRALRRNSGSAARAGWIDL